MMTMAHTIATAERELTTRQTAAPYLRGIVAQQNANSIDHLYDVLNHLHIADIERRNP